MDAIKKLYLLTKGCEVKFNPWYSIEGNWHHIIMIENQLYVDGDKC